MLPFKLNAVVPIGCVKQWTFVLFKAGNGGPPPVIQDTGGIDQDVSKVSDLLA